MEVFEHSRRVVRVSINGGKVSLTSPLGALPCDAVSDVGAFSSQMSDGDYLDLERRGFEQYCIRGIVKRGSVLHEIYGLAERCGLEFGFDESVEAETAELIDAPIDFSDCEDFGDVPFVTVDGAGTRDLDQALYVGRRDDALNRHISTIFDETEYIAWYAIADASWFVRPNTPLYRSALARGASIYFAGMSASMLPAALSRGLISLNPGVDRRALVFIMQIAGDGVCVHTDLRRARVQSRAKLTCEEVSAFLCAPEVHPWHDREFAESLKGFKAVGALRFAESQTRNVVHFNRVALDVGLNSAKTAFTLGLDDRCDVDRYNEQLSLLCNIEGVAILQRRAQEDPEVLAIFRNHEAPSLRDVAELEASIAALARAQNLDDAWIWNRSAQSLADFFDHLPAESCNPDIEKPEEIRLFRIRQAMERLVLMVQRRSVFSPEAGLHSALGVNPYARFSAPMREMVGIFTHKEAVESEFAGACALSREENAELRKCVIESSNKAKTAQRNIDKAIDSCAIAHVIRSDYELAFDKRPRRRGTILGMKAEALYVRLDMPPIELKVYIRDMAEYSGQAWLLNDEKTILTREDGAVAYRVGDSMDVVVASYEPNKRKYRVVAVDE